MEEHPDNIAFFVVDPVSNNNSLKVQKISADINDGCKCVCNPDATCDSAGVRVLYMHYIDSQYSKTRLL